MFRESQKKGILVENDTIAALHILAIRERFLQCVNPQSLIKPKFGFLLLTWKVNIFDMALNPKQLIVVQIKLPLAAYQLNITAKNKSRKKSSEKCYYDQNISSLQHIMNNSKLGKLHENQK